MVHPYLRRRQGLEQVEYPAPDPAHGPPDELARVLGRTLGVPLFQEQAMRIAIEAARFTPEEANRLRRSMATFRNLGTIHAFHDKMVEGMLARGYERDFAERCFNQIEGFGKYGFPESHAASFALLVYVSAWIKCHHPAVFAAALLNAQPMGFYAPAQIVRDAREHGVCVLGVDAQASGWDCAVDRVGCLRLGLRLIDGFQQAWAEQLVAARGAGFQDFASLAGAVPRPALLALAEADALGGLGGARREALWSAAGWREEDRPLLPRDEATPAALRLPAPGKAESVVEDYRSTGLSLRGHPLGFLRAGLAADAVTCAQASVTPDGTFVAVSGLVLIRQRPGSANGVVFATIEDESGIMNVVIWPDVSAAYRAALLGSRLLRAEGHIQRWQGPGRRGGAPGGDKARGRDPGAGAPRCPRSRIRARPRRRVAALARFPLKQNVTARPACGAAQTLYERRRGKRNPPRSRGAATGRCCSCIFRRRREPRSSRPCRTSSAIAG